MVRKGISLLLLLGLAGLALAQPLPPSFKDYVFVGFLEVTMVGEEPLPTLIRREYPDKPALWSQLESYLATYYPGALTAPRSRILKRGARLRLPLYGLPAPPVVTVAPPPPRPVEPPTLPPSSKEPVIGALIAAEPQVSALGSLGQARMLKVQDTVLRGDTITTDERGEAQLRLLDGTLVLLRPDSSVLLKEFRFARPDANAGALHIKLVKGAMRTLSGMIPKDPRSRYALETPAGTMKVRGTDYAVRLCQSNCRLNGEAVEDGLYAGVLEGGIDIGNASGASPVAAGDIVKVADLNAAAEPAPEMAALVFTAEELKQLPGRRDPCRISINQKPDLACNRR